MPRDSRIKEIFEIADDSLQGLVGYYLYVVNAVGCAPFNCVVANLPPNQIPITHAWDRLYRPQELAATMGVLFEVYNRRICLVAMVNIFEVATRSFVERLEEANRPQNIQGDVRSYKTRLKWVFAKVDGSTYGDATMQLRIPQLCLDVDHARRIRNISVHNNGLFNDKYETDAIPVGSNPALIHWGFRQFTANRSKPVAIALSAEDYLRFTRSHIELLHFLHHEIQNQDFGDTTSYDYRHESKRIEWHRLLSGY